MDVVGKLNALDERAGARAHLGPRRWEARRRLWWLNIVLAYAIALVGVVLAALDDGSPWVALPLALLPGAFYSGFLYNERLRALGRRPRLLEVPATWGDAPQAAPRDTEDVITA